MLLVYWPLTRKGSSSSPTFELPLVTQAPYTFSRRASIDSS